MEIDAHNLPEEAGLLRQIVLQLLGVVDEKDRLLGDGHQQGFCAQFIFF
jgi:hypothetical protein